LARRWDQTTHGASLNKELEKIYNAFMETDDIEELASLANSYGYLLNVLNNMRITYDLEPRIKDLKHMAGLRKK